MIAVESRRFAKSPCSNRYGRDAVIDRFLYSVNPRIYCDLTLWHWPDCQGQGELICRYTWPVVAWVHAYGQRDGLCGDRPPLCLGDDAGTWPCNDRHLGALAWSSLCWRAQPLGRVLPSPLYALGSGAHAALFGHLWPRRLARRRRLGIWSCRV